MQQFQAILWLQFRLFKHTLQGGNKLINTIAGIFNFVMLTIASLGLSIATFFIFYYILQEQDLDTKKIFLPILLDIFLIFITFFWISRPLLSFLHTEYFDINKFLLFPFSFQRLYNINLFASALDPWMLFLYPTLLSFWLAFSITNWQRSLIFAISISMYLLLVIVWGRYLTYYLSNLFRSRKIMERFLLISVVLILLLSLSPQLIINSKYIELNNHTDSLKFEHKLDFALWIIIFTPPGLLTYNILAIYYGDWLGASLSLIALSLFTIWGWYRGRRTLREFFIGKHKSPSAEEIKTTSVKKIDWEKSFLFFLPIPLIAIIEKEIKYIFRSMHGKLVFFIPLIIPFVMRRVSQADTIWNYLNISSSYTILFFTILYMLMIDIHLLNNILGWDKYGLGNLYLFPIDKQLIILGKNISRFIFASTQMTFIIIFHSMIYGILPFSSLIGIITIAIIAIIEALIIGNFASLFFPYKLSFNSQKGQRPGIAELLSVLFTFLQMTILLPLGVLWALVPSFTIKIIISLLFLIGMLALYIILLEWYAKVFEDRKEQILKELCYD